VPFKILFNQEFLAEGTAIEKFLNPDRILIGNTQTKSGLAAAAALKEVRKRPSWGSCRRAFLGSLIITFFFPFEE
jgi:UDP-glucose 6-dehydrogenase